MSLEPNSEARLADVNWELASKIMQLASALEQETIVIRVTQGLRTWQEQARLYAQGRTTPGPIVTHAPPGHSWHQMGLAVDIVPDDLSKIGFQADWNIHHPVWQRIISLAATFGLTEGAEFRTFPDWPHLQLTGSLPVSPDDAARGLFMEGGIEAVWKAAGFAAG